MLCFLLLADAPPILAEEVTVAYSPRGMALQLVLKELKAATNRVDLAQFYVTHPDLITALCTLSARQIQVRLLADASMGAPARQPTLEKLTKSGVQVVLIDPPKHGKMHLKCLVVDNKTLITGTANWTQQAFDLNFEDTLQVDSPTLAATYLAEMEALVSSDSAMIIHGSRENRRTPLVFPTPQSPPGRAPEGRLNAPGIRSFKTRSPKVGFLPNPDLFSLLADQIRSATGRVDVAMYLLNEERLVSALEDRARSGSCAVRILVDIGMLGAENAEVLQKLANAGADLRIYGNDRESLHLKTGIIDGRWVWTGSANWTKGAMSLNTEDLLCFDSPELAAWYRKWLDEIAKVCQPFAPLQTNAPSSIPQPASASKWPVGLPPSGPRTNWDSLMQHVDFSPLETNAWTAYLSDEAYAPVLLDLIRNAHQTILIAMYKVGEPGKKAVAGFQGKIISELEKAAARGVYVGLLLHIPHSPQDALYESHSRWAERLRAKGIDVRLSLPTLPMHEKLVAVDLCKVIVGSHNLSEGALDGTRVMESSVLILYPRQQKWLADYFFSRPMISDMTSREAWERELTLVRQAARMDDVSKDQFLDSFGVETENSP